MHSDWIRMPSFLIKGNITLRVKNMYYYIKVYIIVDTYYKSRLFMGLRKSNVFLVQSVDAINHLLDKLDLTVAESVLV